MKFLFVAAVDFELDVARSLRAGTGDFFLCTGIGPEATRRSLEPALAAGGFDLAVDIGLAGCYGAFLPLGSVVQVVSERYGDRPDDLFLNPAPPAVFAALPQAAGNTVPALEACFRRVVADVETMEGAAFFEACLAAGVPFAEIRTISNLVGETDHSRWDIPLALQNLKTVLSSL